MSADKLWATLCARAAIAGLQINPRSASPWGSTVGNGLHPETLYLHLPGDRFLTRIDPKMPLFANWPADALKWWRDSQAVAEQFESILNAVLFEATQSGMSERYAAVCPACRMRCNALSNSEFDSPVSALLALMHSRSSESIGATFAPHCVPHRINADSHSCQVPASNTTSALC